MTAWRFAVDRGDTFTDVVATTPGGSLVTEKLLSHNPGFYADAASEAVRRLMVRCGEGPIAELRIGTTVATNALLQRKGERLALAIMRGFGDALRIATQVRPDIFARHIVARRIRAAASATCGALASPSSIRAVSCGSPARSPHWSGGDMSGSRGASVWLAATVPALRIAGLTPVSGADAQAMRASKNRGMPSLTDIGASTDRAQPALDVPCRGPLAHAAIPCPCVRNRKSSMASPKASFWSPTTMCVASAMSL